MEKTALGIFREVQHSPDRESDDYEILRASAKKLAETGVRVLLMKPEEVLAEKNALSRSRPDLIFAMCEREEILSLLGEWERFGTKVVNPTRSVYNTYRHRMVPILKENNIPVPRSVLLNTGETLPADPFLDGVPRWWVKRGDVHNTQKGDVSLCARRSEIEERLDSFCKRGIAQALMQEHVDGDLIKFYGVSAPDSSARKTHWFKWFYHKDQELKRYPFAEQELESLSALAAQSLGLEIYGGDAIVDGKGLLYLIDLNAWPSFALFRDEAASFIVHSLSLNFAKVSRA